MGIAPVAVNGVCVAQLPVYVDITNATDVRRTLDDGDKLEHGGAVLVVDLAATDSLSLEGLHVLVLARADADRRGAELRLAAAKLRVRRFLDLTGTRKLFPLYDSVYGARIVQGVSC